MPMPKAASPVFLGSDVDAATLVAAIAVLEDRIKKLEAGPVRPSSGEGATLTLPNMLGEVADDDEGRARLTAYIDARIDRKLARATAGDADQTSAAVLAVVPAAAPANEDALAIFTGPSGQSMKDPRLKPEHLDGGTGNEIDASVWDMCLFVGHECLGFGGSLALMMGYVLNLVLQVWFSFIVMSALTNQNLNDVKMTGLLRFRLGISHNIQYADSVTSRSMASQICNTEFKLHYAGAQLNFHDDLQSFNQVSKGIHMGKALSVVAQFVWVATIFNEITANYKFARSVMSIPGTSATEVVVADWEGVDGEASHADDPELLKSAVDVRLQSLSRTRRMAALLLIVLPRFFLAGFVGWAGISYLGETHVLGDLILNAIALAFILDCDELIYQIFMPLRVCALQSNLESIPVHTAKRLRWLSEIMPAFRAMLFIVVMMMIYTFVLTPYWWRLAQAQDILCSGEKDFVFGFNRATGMVHISRSKSEDINEWEYVEKVVFQAIHNMTLESKHGWEVPAELQAIYGTQVEAIIEPNRARDLNGTTYTNASFRRILSVQDWSIEDAAGALPCKDLAAGYSKESTLAILRNAFSNQSIQTCRDIPWQLCSLMNMTQLRALCPERCECHRPAHLGSVAGFFGHPKHGCPTQCTSLLGSYNEAKYQIDERDAEYYYADLAWNLKMPACLDSRQDELLFEASCGNLDSETDGDDAGDYCDDEAYEAVDVVDVLASGSINGTLPRACDGRNDDDDFSARLMCCGCGGGERENIVDSFECAMQMTDACLSMTPKARFWSFYVNGLFEYLFARAGFEDMLFNNINATLLGNSLLEVDDIQKPYLVEWITSGNMRGSLLNSSWDFMNEVEHPRELEGCAFLTSWEFRLLLNIDLCASEDFVSIRFLCPVSCGCGVSNTPSECPAACARKEEVQLGQQKCLDEYHVQAIQPSLCPQKPDELKNCEKAQPGELCEGDGECGTDTSLNNCWPNFDVYLKFNPWLDEEEVQGLLSSATGGESQEGVAGESESGAAGESEEGGSEAVVAGESEEGGSEAGAAGESEVGESDSAGEERRLSLGAIHELGGGV